MACENNPNKSIGCQIRAGISKLAGKRGFYAGLALGGAGLLGRGLIALARRRSSTQSAGGQSRRDAIRSTDTSRNASSPQKPDSPQDAKRIKMRRIPHLPARMKIKPTGRSLPASDKCAGCQASADSKPGGPWYSINGSLYCQDCASAAAREADVDLVGNAPKSQDNALKNAKARLGVRLPFKRRSTQLSRSRVRAYIGQDAGRPVYAVVENGYAVVKPSRRPRDVIDAPGLNVIDDTGLTIIPALRLNSTRTNILEDTSHWSIIHVPSGKPLPGATNYSTPEQAHLLADVLARID
jgi:hypothetical protein